MTRLRAIDGGELIGAKLVRSIYLDEAGISNNGRENTVVIAGCILHMDTQWRPVQQRFAELLEKHILPQHRARFVFHAKDLWHGSRVLDRNTYPREARLQIIRELCQIVDEFSLGVVFGRARKSDVKAYLSAAGENSSDKNVTWVAYMTAFAHAASNANSWIERFANDEISSIVIEDSPDLRKYGKTTFKALRGQFPESVGTNDELKELFPDIPLHHIIDEPSYMGKFGAPVLQLADLCAFLIRRASDGNNDANEFLKMIYPQMMASSKLSIDEISERLRE